MQACMVHNIEGSEVERGRWGGEERRGIRRGEIGGRGGGVGLGSVRC